MGTYVNAFIGIDYFDAMTENSYAEVLKDFQDCRVVDCPLDRQVAVKEAFSPHESHLKYTERNEVDDYIDGLLRDKKYNNSVFSVEDHYGRTEAPEETSSNDTEAVTVEDLGE